MDQYNTGGIKQMNSSKVDDNTYNLKTALITGCNRGLGCGIAVQLLEEGYMVIGLNRSRTEDRRLTCNPRYIQHICDISKPEEVRKTFEYEFITNSISGVDLLVCNAGIRRFNTIEKLKEEDWRDSVDTNLNGVFYTVKYCLPFITKSKGDIMIIGSHSEKYTFETGSAYCSTKGALKEFSECLMEEVRYDDVRVSYLSLGSIKNRDHNIDEDWKLLPEQVGDTVVALAKLPKNVLVPYMDIRPAKPLKNLLSGIEKLQCV